MPKRPKECLARLIVGVVLNIGLWLVCRGICGRGGILERDIPLSLIGGALAGATWVFVVPVFWRGAPWQVPVAFAVVFFLPCLVLVSVVANALQYW
jgi:hypothetical protein